MQSKNGHIDQLTSMGGQAFVKEQFMPPEIPNKTNIKSPKFESPSLSCGILGRALFFIQGQKNLLIRSIAIPSQIEIDVQIKRISWHGCFKEFLTDLCNDTKKWKVDKKLKILFVWWGKRSIIYLENIQFWGKARLY